MLSKLERPRFVLPALAAIAATTFALAAFHVPSSLSQSRSLDVPYVPTPEHIVEAMLRLAKPGPDDYLVDLGCGDGRIPITAAQKYGTRGFGVDLNPERIKEARANAAKARVTDKVEFVEGDLFKTDFQKATVLTLYLLPQVNMRLRPSVLDMKPGTRVVSHAFHMEDWEADVTEQHDFRTVYHWVVPAKAAGRWAGTAGAAKIELNFEQTFQVVKGTATIDGKASPITKGLIKGEEIAFEVASPDGQARQYSGRISGATIEGQGWRASKM